MSLQKIIQFPADSLQVLPEKPTPIHWEVTSLMNLAKTWTGAIPCQVNFLGAWIILLYYGQQSVGLSWLPLTELHKDSNGFKFPAELKEGQLTQQVSASLLHAGRAAQIGAWMWTMKVWPIA